MQVQTDGSFDFCDSKLGVIVFGVNSLRGKFRPVSWSLVPNESSHAFSLMHFQRFTTERVKLSSVCSHRAHFASVRRAKVASYAIKFVIFNLRGR